MAELVDGSNVSEDVSSESTDGDADAAEGDAGGHHGAQDGSDLEVAPSGLQGMALWATVWCFRLCWCSRLF